MQPGVIKVQPNLPKSFRICPAQVYYRLTSFYNGNIGLDSNGKELTLF
jgi:hypothetical protein